MIEDSDFKSTIEILISVYCTEGTTSEMAAIVSEYTKRKLPVNKNIAQYCGFKHHVLNLTNKFSLKILENSLSALDIYYPQLNFGIKNYNCIINELEKMKWSGINKCSRQ